MKKPRSFFRKNPRSETLLLAGVHPNCESMTLLVSDGKQFRGISHFLRRPFTEVAVEFARLARKIEPKLDRLDRDRFFQRLRGQLLIIRTLAPWALRTIRFWRLLKGGSLRNALFGRKSVPGAPARKVRKIVRVAVLPFEEQHSIDAARLEQCKAVFAYEDTDDGQVKYFPACGWYPYRNQRLQKISRKYGVVGRQGAEPAPTPASQGSPQSP